MSGFGGDAYLMPPLTLADTALDDSEAARQLRYKTYLDFYEGAQWLEKRRPGERRLTINYARTLVHKAASYLMAKPVQFELIPHDDSPEAQAVAREVEATLRQIWDDNGLAELDYNTAVDAAVLGDGCFKVTRQAASSGPRSRLEVDPRPGRPARKVLVRSVDVANIGAGWAGDDLTRLLWVREAYRLSAGEARARWGAGAVRGPVAEVQTVAVVEIWTDSSFVVEVEGRQVAGDTLNPYGFIPYLIFPNLARPRRSWGLSDIEDIMSLNSEFNVRVSVLSQLLQMSGNPVLVLENVEEQQGLRVGPGAVWTLPEGAKASLLEMLKDGTVGLHLSYIELLYRMIHDLSELPASGFGRDGTGTASSGVALEQLLYSVVQKIARKRVIWDEVLDRRNRMIAALAGLEVHRSKIIWPDILPRDRAGLVTQEVGLVASRIHSLDTARRALGDEQPDGENERIGRELAELLAAGAAPSGGAAAGVQGPVRLSGALVEGLARSGG